MAHSIMAGSAIKEEPHELAGGLCQDFNWHGGTGCDIAAAGSGQDTAFVIVSYSVVKGCLLIRVKGWMSHL